MPEFNNSSHVQTSARGGSFGGIPPNKTGSASAWGREPTKEEKFALQDTIEENKRKGFFHRIFPTVDYLYYRQFMQEERPLNKFLDDRLMAKKRDTTHAARQMYEKLPLFLHPGVLSARDGLNTAGSAVKIGGAPPSGSGANLVSMASITSDPIVEPRKSTGISVAERNIETYDSNIAAMNTVGSRIAQ